MQQGLFFNREISWLSFNHRVLQEASDSANPLMERIKFLAIFSSNLDEFYRVRVASVKSLASINKKTKKHLAFSAKKVLKQIHKTVLAQQEEFGNIFFDQLIPELKQVGVVMVNDQTLPDSLHEEVNRFFDENISGLLQTRFLDEEDVPFLENRELYLAVTLYKEDEEKVVIVNIPSDEVGRLQCFRVDAKDHCVIFIDDIIRLNLSRVFSDYEVTATYAIKLSRDADLHIEDEYSGDLVEKIKSHLDKRLVGAPSRLLYDLSMPRDEILEIGKLYEIAETELVEGGRYHNFNDFFGFPNPDQKIPEYNKLPPLDHTVLSNMENPVDVLSQADQLLHFPYQSYDPIVRLLQDAAKDDSVEQIRMTLYRAAKESKLMEALIDAAQNGKRVTVFVEVKARFDEKPNLFWADQLEAAGANVLYSMPGIKVHAKICQITRKVENEKHRIAILSTGNFNEKTARVYADHALITTNPKITEEIIRVFDMLEGKILSYNFKHLLVAPHYMRQGFEDLIDFEIEQANQGKRAEMFLKMNSLEDKEIIQRLYDASNAGVKIRLVVRGICCLIPGVPGQSENIEVRSIVGRFLEHARVYRFYHAGEDRVFLASADWMHRNLSKRVELGFPIYAEHIKNELSQLYDLQWQDNVKARLIDLKQKNRFIQGDNQQAVNSQIASYQLLKQKIDGGLSTADSLETKSGSEGE